MVARASEGDAPASPARVALARLRRSPGIGIAGGSDCTRAPGGHGEDCRARCRPRRLRVLAARELHGVRALYVGARRARGQARLRVSTRARALRDRLRAGEVLRIGRRDSRGRASAAGVQRPTRLRVRPRRLLLRVPWQRPHGRARRPRGKGLPVRLFGRSAAELPREVIERARAPLGAASPRREDAPCERMRDAIPLARAP